MKIFKNNKRRVMSMVILFLGVLLIFSSYAWFSTNLNVKIKEFNMLVAKNGGLSISFDAINYDTAIEISRDVLITDLTETYPNHVNQWALNGLIPVSTAGVLEDNSYFFDVFETEGVTYKRNRKDDGYIYTEKAAETKPRSYNYFVAFDVFFKNVTGSPIPDHLYFDKTTSITTETDGSPEMRGLINSLRVGIVKVGTMPNGTDPTLLQNMKCEGKCEAIIFEPYSTNHTELSIERAQKYDINLLDGRTFPTYAMKKAGGPIYVKDNISGSPNLDLNYFTLQNTIHEEDFDRPLFEIPDGITKARVYLWVEGQDIDSLETDSEGADLYVDIYFVKDTAGYAAFEE